MLDNHIFIPLLLSIEEYDVLLKAIDYYNYATSTLEYGEHIEECQNIRSKIMRHIGTRKDYVRCMTISKEKENEED